MPSASFFMPSRPTKSTYFFTKIESPLLFSPVKRVGNIILSEQITIDGPAASGKSTLAQLVAKKVSGFYINTGDMYRTLTWAILERNYDLEADRLKILNLLNEVNIHYERKNTHEMVLLCNGKPIDYNKVRAPEITARVSEVAAIPEVRHWMVACQRKCAKVGLIVMEGRDIGTVVFPEAHYKFFVTASPEARAKRRLAQDGEVTEGATLEKVAEDIARRDYLDMHRPIAPLKQADDAAFVDTSNMTVEQATDQIVKLVKDKQSQVHA
jgi:CMP/dCMP kinase